MSGHERERLSAYLDGELAPGERAAVEAHLAACPECTAFLADLATVDEAGAALPAEAPEGYFDSFAARVRARLKPRGASPVYRVPAWAWAAAAALLLAVITPLTLRQLRPSAAEGPFWTPTPPPVAPAEVEAERAEGSRASERRAETVPRTVPRPRPRLPDARPRAAQAPAAPGPAAPPAMTPEAAARERADALSPLSRDQATALEAPARVESEPVLGGEAPQDTADREKAAPAASGSAVAAGVSSPYSAAAAPRAARAAAALEEQEDAFRRLEAVRPRSGAGWRRLREQWSALAAAETDPLRADEARVRAVIAAREAWRAGGDEGDEAAFRAAAEGYLRREDARQKPRVERLLAEP